MPKRKRPSKEPTSKDEQPAQHKQHPENTKPRQQDTAEEGVQHFEISSDLVKKPIICERHQPQAQNDTAPPALVFTHGAGGGITAAATRDFAIGFGTKEPIVSFQGTMNLSNRVKAFRAVVDDQKPKALGGRSMGARAAVLTALAQGENGRPEALVLVSWPLTAGKEGKREPERREQILKDLPDGTDVLFVVGDRDEMCDLEMLEEVRAEMKAMSWLVVVKGADHGMSLKKKEAIAALRRGTGEIAADWSRERDRGKRYRELGWDDEKGEIWCSEWTAKGDR